MYKQETWMVYEYHENAGHNCAVFLFAESGGQTLGNVEGQNKSGNLKGSEHNFQLSVVVNILVSVTSTCKVLCLLLQSASHKSCD